MKRSLTEAQVAGLRRIAFRVSRRVLRNDDDAYDIAQDTVRKLLELSVSPDSLAAWCHQTARNLSLNRVRDTGRRRRILERNWIDPDACPADAFEKILLEQLLQQSPPRAAQALVCRFVQGMTSRETAHCLGVSERTVRDDIARVRTQLRTLLLEEGRPS